MQQILLNTLFESAVGIADPWTGCIQSLAHLVHECAENNVFKSVVAHLVIAMLYQGKVTEKSYPDYAFLIAQYLKTLHGFPTEIQIFYANFLLKKDQIIAALSGQFFGTKEERQKQEVLSYLGTHFGKEKEAVLENMWETAFQQAEGPEVLIDTVQWFLLDVILVAHFSE